MRVALVGPYPVDPERIGGGVETAFVNLVEGLAASPDVDVRVLSFVRGARVARDVETGPAPVTFLPGTERLNNATLYRGDRRTLARALVSLRPDVVHAQDALGYGFTCLKVGHEAPLVVSIHGIVREELKHLPRLVDRVRTRVARVPMERYCVRHARYLVQPTRYPELYFGDEIRGRIVDVGNAISGRFFAVEPAPEPGRVLYSGAIMLRKRLLDLVEAIAGVRASVPDVRLRVAGAPSDVPYAAAVRERIAELDLEEHVSLLGALTPEQLAEEYRHAALYVLPSGQETSPMGIGEAMAAAVPVVATRTGGVPYLVDEGVTGFVVDVGDIDALGSRIAEVLGDEEGRAELSVAARAAALRRFRGDVVAARVLDVYRTALADESRV